MVTTYAPVVLVPLIGLIFPAVAMATWFVYMERQQIS